MMPHDPATWWTAFGAIAQAAGAVATFAAVAISLWIVFSERAMKASGSADIKLLFAGDGSPEQRLVGIEVLNAGVRPFHVSGVGWRTGWLPFGPQVLRYRQAMMDATTLNQTPGPHIIEPGRTEGFYRPMADMAQSASRAELFERKLPILGEAPIRAVVHITGRRPLRLKVSKGLEAFLRTGNYP